MPIILETDKFIVKAHDVPHHDRDNGGHAVVSPKERFSDRTQMPMSLYVSMMKLVMLTGEAITTVMKQKGVDIARINYQDNGNWAYFPSVNKEPDIHIHLYVRSNSEAHPTGDERFKSFPDALYFPFIEEAPEFYAPFKPYSNEDVSDILGEMQRLLSSEKYDGLEAEL